MTNHADALRRAATLGLALGLLLPGCVSEVAPASDPGGTDPGVDTSEDVAAEVEAEVEPEVEPDVEPDIPVEVEPDVPPPPPVFFCEAHGHCEGELCGQVLIEGGEYYRGTEEEPETETTWPAGDARPVHLVHVDTFCIDKYETTLEHYENCVDAGICSPAGLLWEKADAPYETTVNHYPEECYADLDLCKEFAVNGKTYHQARNYCEWIGARLCTEAEWERAANGPGPEKRLHPWGNDPPTYALVNIPSTGYEVVEPVDSHAAGASAEGVFNMAGNVYEWVEDAYAPYSPAPNSEPLVNPTNPPLGQMEVIGRGSCFFTEPKHTVTDRTIFSQAFDWG